MNALPFTYESGPASQVAIKPVRLVFGTASGQWHKVGPADRDYGGGITAARFAEIGESAARAEYLAPSMVGGGL